MLSDNICSRLVNKKFSLHSEKVLQQEIDQQLSIFEDLQREYRLDSKNIIDFFIEGVGIEVKIKGSRKDIYYQCKRYCGFPEIKSLILITNRALGFPNKILDKPCYIINLGLGWL